MPERARVRFKRPPVVEVVCGILFGTPRPLRGAHVGLYWQRVCSDFPRIEEAPPLPPVIERQAPGPATLSLGIRLIPPLRRTWLLSADGRNLIQVQEDRFIFNWKKAAAGDDYPSYEHVIEGFNRHLAGFLEFLDTEEIGPPSYLQFELAYVNHIHLGETPDRFAVSPTRIFVDHVRAASVGRFLPEPEAVNWNTAYPLPNGEGRLHTAARSVLSPQGTPILELEMTARGLPADASDATRQAWFDQAHVWITQGFADITASDIQRSVWGRIA